MVSAGRAAFKTGMRTQIGMAERPQPISRRRPPDSVECTADYLPARSLRSSVMTRLHRRRASRP